MAEEEKTESKNIVQIEDSGPCRKKISIEVPAEVIKEKLDKQYSDLRKEAAVPGFRKGRAPLRLLEKRFGSDVREQVKLKLLADASEEITKNEKLDILGEPDIDHEKIELPDEGPMKFEFEAEVRPQFDLPELEGIAIDKTKAEISDKRVDEHILAMRKRAGLWVPKEDAAIESGDQVIADLKDGELVFRRQESQEDATPLTNGEALQTLEPVLN